MAEIDIEASVNALIEQNRQRLQNNAAPFNPVTGMGSVGERTLVEIPDYPIPRQWLPDTMLTVPLVKKIIKAGSIRTFITDTLRAEYSAGTVDQVVDQFVRVRNRHDFPFWAATFVYIQNKEGGGEVLFRLTRPQRKFVAKLEEKRLASRPIRLVLLKARQWGGSTTSQLYMMWLQLVHKTGLNSIIIAQTKKTSFAIKDMFDRALNAYPVQLLHRLGEAYSPGEPKMVNVGQSGDYKRIPQRDCKITIASYEAPDAVRGDNYSLVHCSEVGLWSPTDLKSPDSVVRSACSGILLRPYTMIIFESTANGTGNFFQREYDAAKAGRSQFDALFISWFDIDHLYSKPFEDENQRREFARSLIQNKQSHAVASSREEPGWYLWWLWEQGATLEGINWYIEERSGKESHAVMAAEYPTDDDEAFVHSGSRVFDKSKVKEIKKSCRPPQYIGDVYADADEGRGAFSNVRFTEDSQGLLWIWNMPEIDPAEKVLRRYLVMVDIGGRSVKADWSVIVVFDRLPMIDGERPVVVAQWYGHIDIDRLAWKAGQIAAWYDNALLVIESNTLETHDKDRQVDGDQSHFVLNQLAGVYPNLYARSRPEDSIIDGLPVKYGFHTNTATKPMVISTLVKCIRERMWIERDERACDEFNAYEKRQNGSFGAIKGKHDDILMTRAIGLHICFYDMDLPSIAPRQSTSINRHRTSSNIAAI